MRKYTGFTLIEVLLAMLLMAFVAVLILPGVTKNAEQQLFATQLKKVQNDLQQAMLIILARNKNDFKNVFNNSSYRKNVNGVAVGNKLNNLIFTNAINSALQASCVYYSGDTRTTNNPKTNPSVQAGLFYINKPDNTQRYPIYMNKTYLYNSYPRGVNINEFAAANLRNGATVRPVITNTNCSDNDGNAHTGVCGFIEVDLNGIKKPNTVGKDIHFFWIFNSDDGIVPFGENDTYNCTLDGTGNFANDADCLGCTYRVISDGKMNYY